MKKKVILLYPYYRISGAYNRYLLLGNLARELVLMLSLSYSKDRKFNSTFTKIIYKLIKFIKVECLIFFYSLFKRYYFITDFNPSIIALFSKNVLIQIHDVSWENKKFVRHKFFSY